MKNIKFICFIFLLLTFFSSTMVTLGLYEEYELYYDDGELDFGFAGGDVAAVKFSTSQSIKILKLRFYLSGSMNDIIAHILNSNFESIFSLNIAPASGWFDVNVSSSNVKIKGDFYIALQRPYGEPWLGVDNDPPHNLRSYLGTIGNPGQPKEDEDYMIRCIVTPVSDRISDFSDLFSYNYVRMIYPSDNPSKPLDCGAAMVSDWTASAFIFTKLEYVTEGFDTNPGFVNQATGKALGDSGVGIISFGGPFVNPVVKYAESASTPAADRAPVKFHTDGDTFHFQYANGTNIPGAELPLAVINEDEDMFVIEVYEDADGRYVMLCYGFGWKGTYAAGKYFDTEIYPNLESYPYSWIIVKWEDSNENGFVNTTEGGDTYILVASG